MPSSEVFSILREWKKDGLAVFGFWSTNANRSTSVSLSFEGWITEVDETEVRVSGEPSTRIRGSNKLTALFRLDGAIPSEPDPRRVRFTFESGAVLDLLLS